MSRTIFEILENFLKYFERNKLFFSLAEIRYTKDHYWVERIKSTDEYKVGLSDYAQDSYGDFVVVEIERMNEIVDKDGK